MGTADNPTTSGVLLIVAGAKGAVASTVAVAVAALAKDPRMVAPFLTTAEKFAHLGPLAQMAGWDVSAMTMAEALSYHGVLRRDIWQRYVPFLTEMTIRPAPGGEDLRSQIDQIKADMNEMMAAGDGLQPVLINLLPAGGQAGEAENGSLAEVYETVDPALFPDLAYVLAAIDMKIPVVNFSPNSVEVPAVVAAAQKAGVAISGRDGKTGQTYFKVVLASALKARSLFVDGWYSLNILGNRDGHNLKDPERAAGKLANKTDLLDEILGYRVGGHYDAPSHQVRIDYYPPRGDAKEAWDVIDFKGLFGLPMSLRLNLQGRDSILAAPMVIDLARWMAALQKAGRKGPVAELGFYYKKAVGQNPAASFEEQLHNLKALEKECEQ